MTSFLAAFLISTCALLAQTVEGTVVNSVSGEPILGATVTIENQAKASYQGISDSQGAFRIEGTSEGSYTPVVSKPGFQTSGSPLPKIHVTLATSPFRLHLSMIPLAKISGRVLDGNGNPVPDAEVVMVTKTREGQDVRTDSEGGFLLEMRPGKYLLSAKPPTAIPPPKPEGDQHYGWAQTWFPGVSDTDAAAEIVVVPGTDIVGQDIKLRVMPLHVIRGIVHDIHGNPVANVAIKAFGGTTTRDTISTRDGNFQFADLGDGAWYLSSEAVYDGTKLRAAAQVTLAGRDQDEADLGLTAPFTLRGEFLLKTADSTKKIPGGIFLEPESGDHLVGSESREGSFQIYEMYPGRYQVGLDRNIVPASYYLDAILLGDSNVLGQVVEIDSGDTPLRVVYGSDGGSIRGTVDGCVGGSVVVVSEDPAFQRREYMIAPKVRCSDGGQFEVQNLRPGRYYAFAFDHLEATTWEFLGSVPALINKAEIVEVRPKEISFVELRITPR